MGFTRFEEKSVMFSTVLKLLETVISFYTKKVVFIALFYQFYFRAMKETV